MTEGSINETSKSLGRLEAQMGQALKCLEDLTKRFDALETEYALVKNRGYGVLVGIGLIGGTVGAAVKTKLAAIFGG